MQNDQSGARKQRKESDQEVLSPVESAARDRGRHLKRYIRAAAALNEIYNDTELGEAVGVGRGAVKAWWEGVQMKPDNVRETARVTGLSVEGLMNYVYYEGPLPTLPVVDPASLPVREGVRRGQARRGRQVLDTPPRQSGPRPRGSGAGHG